MINRDGPRDDSLLRIERFSERVQRTFAERYEGVAPHDKPPAAQKAALALQEGAGEDDGTEEPD